MAVLKTLARLRADDDALLGEGRAYIHLRLPPNQPQAVQGTLSLDWWDDFAGTPARLEVVDGPTLPIQVDADRLSECMLGRILRYRTQLSGGETWPTSGT